MIFVAGEIIIDKVTSLAPIIMLEVSNVIVKELSKKSLRVSIRVDAFRSLVLEWSSISIPEINLTLSGLMNP